MELVSIEESWEKSTYLSKIFDAVDAIGDKFIIKKNRTSLTEAQHKFFHWLMKEQPEGFLIPVEFSGEVGEKPREIYHFYYWPTLDKFLVNLFPAGREPKNGWSFSHALRAMDQVTSCLGTLNSQGFIHHDVRPGNFFIDSGAPRLTLFDYNSLREPYFLDEGRESWNDVPPEYKQGNCDIDYRFDVYQAGKLFFELTHGYVGETVKKIPGFNIPDKALEVIAKASHEKLKERYADCNEFHEVICSLRN